MNDNKDKCHENRDAVDISVWENEGGALDRSNISHLYGRRIEPDGSWTIYHVFTGAPADVGSRPMAGLGETDATTTMIILQPTFATRF
jgi:hypothetical protein